MQCPRDQTTLRIDQHTNRDAYLCRDCHGIFLGHSEIPEQYRISERGKTDLKFSNLGCPSCQKPMRELCYRHQVIDLCISCQSVWLDAGEHKEFADQLKRIKQHSGFEIPDLVAEEALEFLLEAVTEYTIEALMTLMD